MAFITPNDVLNADNNIGRLNRRRPISSTTLFSLMILLSSLVPLATCISTTHTHIHPDNEKPQQREQQQSEERENQLFLQDLRIKALHNLQRSLESLSSLTVNSLMLNAALQTPPSSNELFQSLDDNDELEENMEEQQLIPSSTISTQLDEFHPTTIIGSPQQYQSKEGGIRRIRADLREMPPSVIEANGASTTAMESTRRPETKTITPDDDDPSAIHIVRRSTGTKIRQMRSTLNRHGHGHDHHRRRRKGCPSVHSKDQLLCPTRNTHRYDVCITREQLCDRVRDCPGGEDEDPRHCFFFRPLETSLKTISHAVLLLVDTVMREQEKQQQQQQQRNEL